MGDVDGRMGRLLSVLVVDDDERIVAAIARSLGHGPFVPRTARTARAAEEVVAQTAVDLALVDLRLPEGADAGIGIITTVQRTQPTARSALITGVLEYQAVADATHAGARVIAEKAVPLPKILRALRSTEAPVVLTSSSSEDTLVPIVPMDTRKKQYARSVLLRCRGNKAEAARQLDISRNGLEALLRDDE